MVHVYKVKDGHGVIMQRLSVGKFPSKAMACLKILAFPLCVLYSRTLTPDLITIKFPHEGGRGLRLHVFQDTQTCAAHPLHTCTVTVIHTHLLTHVLIIR